VVTKVEYIIQQQMGNPKKLLELKMAIACFIALFVALLGLGQILSNNILTITGLLCFTAAAAAITYYMVLTQP
jgi:hypothetical protein